MEDLSLNGLTHKKRTEHCLGISNSLLCSLLRSRKQGHTNEEKSVKRVKLDKLDNFDKELTKNTVFGLFNKNECATLRKLEAFLAKNCDLEISKYKLWKTLHIWEQKVFSRKN